MTIPLFIIGILSGLVEFFAKFLTQKLAIAAANIAFAAAIWAGLLAAKALVISSINPASMPAEIGNFIGCLLPDNAFGCLSAIATARVYKAGAYRIWAALK